MTHKTVKVHLNKLQNFPQQYHPKYPSLAIAISHTKAERFDHVQSHYKHFIWTLKQGGGGYSYKYKSNMMTGSQSPGLQ